MKRRDFITLGAAAAVAWPPAAGAQQTDKTAKVGVLWPGANAEAEGANFKSLVKGFSDLGTIEGRNITLEHRFANEMPDRFTRMATELISSNVDVLIGVGNNAASYAKNATTTIPVVFILVDDPVASKLVESLSQPGGNATGISNSADDLMEKHLQHLKEMIPGLSRAALLINPNDPASRLYAEAAQAAAADAGFTVQTVEWRSLNDLGPAFDTMKKAAIQVFITNPDGLAFTHRAVIARIALARNLPSSAWSREVLKAGALMSYGADYNALCQRAAVYADKILRGAKPGELPVEKATKFALLVNRRSAKALGLTLPEALLRRADEVID